MKKNELSVSSVTDGQIVYLSRVNDKAFSSEQMGKGIAFISKKGDVYAPTSGEISLVFPTKHAYGIKTPENIELLIHLGINTVELKGKYFESFVTQGQTVKQGQKIAHFNLDKISQAGYDPTIMLIVTEPQGLVPQVCVADNQEVTKSDKVINLIQG